MRKDKFRAVLEAFGASIEKLRWRATLNGFTIRWSERHRSENAVLVTAWKETHDSRFSNAIDSRGDASTVLLRFLLHAATVNI